MPQLTENNHEGTSVTCRKVSSSAIALVDDFCRRKNISRSQYGKTLFEAIADENSIIINLNNFNDLIAKSIEKRRNPELKNINNSDFDDIDLNVTTKKIQESHVFQRDLNRYYQAIYHQLKETLGKFTKEEIVAMISICKVEKQLTGKSSLNTIDNRNVEPKILIWMAISTVLGLLGFDDQGNYKDIDNKISKSLIDLINNLAVEQKLKDKILNLNYFEGLSILDFIEIKIIELN